MDDIYENIEEYKPNKTRKTLIAFDDNKKPYPIDTKFFIGGKNTKVITNCFIVKLSNKREL